MNRNIMKVLYVHIPKNAGTYLSINLAANFRLDEQYIVDESSTKLQDFLDNRAEVIDGHQFVTGHIPFRFVSPLAHKFDLIISSYRDPWARCWSFFRYITKNSADFAHLKPTSPTDAPEKFSRFIDEYFINNIDSRNHQCGYLGEMNLPDSAMANIDDHNIQILSSKSIEDDLHGLAKKYGLKLMPDAPKNETPFDGIRVRQGEYEEIDRKIYQWFDGDYELMNRIDKRRADLTGSGT